MLLHGSLLLLSIVGVKSPSAMELIPKGSQLAYVEITGPSTSDSSTTSVVATTKTQRSRGPEVTSADDVFEKTQKEIPQTDTLPHADAAVVGAATGIVGQGQQFGSTHGREGVENGAEVSPEARYLYELKKLLERKKMYPQMARAMGYTGTVHVEFTIGREGEIQSLKVVKSAHPLLDEAAQKLVRSIEKQKPFPHEITKTDWTISVPIEYALR